MQRGTVTYPNTIWVRLSDVQVATLHAMAEADDRPPSALARRLLVEAMERRTPTKEVSVT